MWSFSDAITTELTAPSSTVAWLAITMVDDGGSTTTTINAHGQVEWTLPHTWMRAKPASTIATTPNDSSQLDADEPDPDDDDQATPS